MFRYIRNALLGATKKHIRRNKTRSSRRLRIEGLEGRQMMTAGFTTSLSSGPALSAVAAPAAPSFTATRVSATQVDLSWNTVPGASGYLVDEIIPVGPVLVPGEHFQPQFIRLESEQIASLGSSVTGCSVTGLSPGLSPGTNCTLDVAAYNSAGTSWATPQRPPATTTLSPPVAPSFTVTTASSTQINIAWNTVSSASGYLVQQFVNGAWSQIASLGSGVTSYSVTGLNPSTTYSFKVAACNAGGTTWANSRSATTSTSPGPFLTSFQNGEQTLVEVDLATGTTTSFNVGYWSTDVKAGNFLAFFANGGQKVTEVDLAAHTMNSFNVGSWSTEKNVGNFLEFYENGGQKIISVNLAAHAMTSFDV
jgi:hypothetical protein